MLFGMPGPLSAGDHVDIALRTADDRQISMRIEVRTPESQP
jgi:hypothetical protein